ncbi:hypothetical protein QA612_02325 [Evansella sp. AB-P1]|uniref:hypothetical protein n=1 Tax=Evansella sp. AB-P1 TaxID=3037653 RepID=UPI0024202A66|nr:hypothetical protein [Evansella sp. AB-P1]MDG5786310.1 hypothetical protein [Evansella sp. AB-P1]
MKSWLTAICFLLIPILYFLVGIVGLPLNGIVFWTGTTILTLFGAYFTKYLHFAEEGVS